MINQVTNSTNKNVFTPLQSNNGVNYAISKPFTPVQIQEDKDRKKTFGLNLAKAGISTALVVLLVTKGLPKKARSGLDKIIKALEEKTSNIKSGDKTFSGIKGAFL